MKIFLMTLTTLLSLTGANADIIEINVSKPIAVNQAPVTYYNEIAGTVNRRLTKEDHEDLIVSGEVDYLVKGKIYTVKDFAAMPVQEIIALRESDGCELSSGAYTYNKSWSWTKLSEVVTSVTLQGKLRVENWYPNASNDYTVDGNACSI